MRHIAGRRALIWPIHHIASVPAIMGIQGTMASVPWIFVQTMVSPGHPDLPHLRREALCYIPGVAGRDSKGGSWV